MRLSEEIRKTEEAVRVAEQAFLRIRPAVRPGRTERELAHLLEAEMRDLGRVVPVHYQEPFRRDFSKGWQPTAEHFVDDLRGAVESGAAGWCFHNGDNRWADDAEPRRSFDMRSKRLFEQLDTVEWQAVNQFGAAVEKALENRR